MPTVLRVGPYLFYFYSHELGEPPHIHVDRENKSAKFWLRPLALARNHGFRPAEISKLRKIVLNNRAHLLSSWRDYFDRHGK